MVPGRTAAYGRGIIYILVPVPGPPSPPPHPRVLTSPVSQLFALALLLRTEYLQHGYRPIQYDLCHYCLLLTDEWYKDKHKNRHRPMTKERYWIQPAKSVESLQWYRQWRYRGVTVVAGTLFAIRLSRSASIRITALSCTPDRVSKSRLVSPHQSQHWVGGGRVKRKKERRAVAVEREMKAGSM